MLRDMEAKGLAANTATKGYNCLSAALDVAVSDGLISHNVIRKGKVKPPRTDSTEDTLHALTERQVNTLLRYLRETKHRLYALYLVAVRTGVREGELLGLRWIDIKWDARELHITGQLQYRRKRGRRPGR